MMNKSLIISQTKDIQIPKHSSSLSVEDTSVHNTIPILNPSLSIPSMVTPGPQDRWSQGKHIELLNIIGNPGDGMLTKAMAKELSAVLAHECLIIDFLSEEEPIKVSEALQHPGWVDAMQEELNQFAKNKVWTLVSAPYAQGYNQQEGIDYDETFSHVVRLEPIRVFLAFATYMNFIVCQMDVKIAILNGKLKEEVYVKQPPGFESMKTPMVPPNKLGPDLNGKAVNETQYRGMIGSLMYLTTSRHDIQFLTCLCARYQANPKESHLIAVKRIFRYVKGTLSLGLWYLKCLGFDLKGYPDSDYTGCNMDKKSTSSACQLLGSKLVC
ncbi:retrovirus-related pol polyprotein from transposon TNT 1-94 [Tanacetum coccineum]